MQFFKQQKPGKSNLRITLQELNNIKPKSYCIDPITLNFLFDNFRQQAMAPSLAKTILITNCEIIGSSS